MTDNPNTCQKCGSPVTPGMRFCESCGAKIDLPVCPTCGAPLAPDRKFCESCGAPVSPAAPAPVNAIPAEAVPVDGPVSPLPEKAPVQEAASPAKPAVEDKKIDAAVAAAVDTWTGADSGTVETKVPKGAKAGPKKPISGQTMIIAGILVLALLGAAAYFVVLPLLSGSGTPLQNPPGIPVPTNAGSSSGTPATTAAASQAGTVSLTPGPTQIPPSNRVVIVDAERDPISSLVTVTFKGGAGQNGVREILVTLTRSDGNVITKTFKPDTIGSGVTLQGTVKTDRVEVTTDFYNGEQYKILDQIFEYKKRGG